MSVIVTAELRRSVLSGHVTIKSSFNDASLSIHHNRMFVSSPSSSTVFLLSFDIPAGLTVANIHGPQELCSSKTKTYRVVLDQSSYEANKTVSQQSYEIDEKVVVLLKRINFDTVL